MKLMLDAAQEGFNSKSGSEVTAVQLEGGASRFRRTQLGAAALISVTWYLRSDQYTYFMAFYRLRTGHGSLPFQVDVIHDSGQIATYTAHFVPGSPELPQINGTVYIVQAQLEVIPLPENPAADLAIIEAYESTLG